MPLFRQLLIIVVLVIAGAGVWYAWDNDLLGLRGTATTAAPTAGAPGGGPPGGGAPGGGRPGGFSRGASLVVTADVAIDSSGLDVRAIGTVESARAVTLYPEVSGIVEEVAFKSGARVEAGDVLVRLADADQALAVDRARLALTDAAAALERAERLATTNNITQVALAEIRNAHQRAELDLRNAELALAKRSVRAPFTGVIGMTDLTIGDLVSSNVAVATLDDTSSVTVAFDVPERATGLVAAGQALTATAEALPGVTLAGEISEVDSRVDPIARTLKVRASLPNTTSRLKPGMAVTVLLAYPGEPRPQVPSLAVQWDREGPYVWKVVGGKVNRQTVEIVGRRSGAVTVLGDIAEGDKVVVEGLQRLREGADVRVAGAGAPQGAGSQAPAASGGAGPRGGDAAAPAGQRRPGGRPAGAPAQGS